MNTLKKYLKKLKCEVKNIQLIQLMAVKEKQRNKRDMQHEENKVKWHI